MVLFVTGLIVSMISFILSVFFLFKAYKRKKETKIIDINSRRKKGSNTRKKKIILCFFPL